MKTRIGFGLEDGLKELVEHEFKSSPNFRRRIIELLEADIEQLHVKMREDEGFELPAWPQKQAALIGQTKAMKKLISLFE